jgi:DNA repair ATPase RecN
MKWMNTDEKLDKLAEAMKGSEKFFEQLFRSLETEMSKRFNQVDARFDAVNARLDHANGRLDRIGGLVNGGGRAIAKMIEWTEKTDVSLADVLRRQEMLEERVRKLEGKQ